MLEAAGVPHVAVRSTVDESALKEELERGTEIASRLAEAKALDVSRRQPLDWVIGSDSTVEVSGRTFDKPRDQAEAAEHLRMFSGQTMRLTSAVALAHGGKVVWTLKDTALLQVRALSTGFIQTYLAQEWPGVSYCVGVFRLEGPGVQLFERIEGSHFTILGLPLLPLLAALRERGILAS